MGNLTCRPDNCGPLRGDAETVTVRCAGVPCEHEKLCRHDCDAQLEAGVQQLDPVTGLPMHVDHDNVVVNAIGRLVLTARKPWPQATMEHVTNRWYRQGGMTLVMDEYFNFHMNRPEGELVKMGLSHKQMTEVRSLLESSGELEELIEAKIRDNMSEDAKKELDDAFIHEIISDDCKYATWAGLKTCIDNRGVALLKGDWLVKQGLVHPDQRIPKRQDLPGGSDWKVSNLLPRLGDPLKHAVAVVAISYCWRSASHPDPDNALMHLLAVLLKEFAGPNGGCTWHGEVGQHTRKEFGDLWRPVGSPGDVAIFIDWCSLHQQPRTHAQEDEFSKAMMNIEVWYAHRGTHVWMFTAVPEGVFTHTEKVALDSQYAARGWPTFEQSVSTLMKDHEMALDMGMLPPLWKRWDDVTSACAAARHPPKRPEHFANDIRLKRFMFKSDCRVLIEKYAKAFNTAICKTKDLSFCGVTWHTIQLVEIGALLPQCFLLETFQFYHTSLGDDGGCILANAMPACRTLRALHLWDCMLGNRTATTLGGLLPKCRNLCHLCLHMNEISDDGAATLSRSLKRSSLSVLRLDHNRIGDSGSASLMDAFPKSPRLQCLVLNNNLFTDKVKDLMEAAWRSAGKDVGDFARKWRALSVEERVYYDPVELEKYGGLVL